MPCERLWLVSASDSVAIFCVVVQRSQKKASSRHRLFHLFFDVIRASPCCVFSRIFHCITDDAISFCMSVVLVYFWWCFELHLKFLAGLSAGPDFSRKRCRWCSFWKHIGFCHLKISCGVLYSTEVCFFSTVAILAVLRISEQLICILAVLNARIAFLLRCLYFYLVSE